MAMHTCPEKVNFWRSEKLVGFADDIMLVAFGESTEEVELTAVYSIGILQLGAMIYDKLNFGNHVEYACRRTSGFVEQRPSMQEVCRRVITTDNIVERGEQVGSCIFHGLPNRASITE